MSTSYSPRIKRYNGTDWDSINPKTLWGSLTDKDTYANVASGWLKLDASGKIPTSLFPSSLITSMELVGPASGTDYDTTGELFVLMQTYATAHSRSTTGLYFVFTADTTITISTGHEVYDEENNGYITSGTVTVEKGDFFICTANEQFAIINNTYQDASSTAFGKVRLSSISTLTGASGNNVITDAVLASLLDSVPTSGNSGKFASSAGIFSALSGKANLSGGNTFSGAQTFTGGVTFGGNITFSANETLDIGSPTYRPNIIYTKYLTVDTIVADTNIGCRFGIDEYETKLEDIYSRISLGSSAPSGSIGSVPVGNSIGDIWLDTTS